MKEVVARLDDFPEKEFHPLIRGLSDAGADGRLARVLRKLGNPQRAVEALCREFSFELAEDPATRRRRLVHGLFASLEEQVENVKRWSHENGWGFTEADIDAHRLLPVPYWPKEKLMVVTLFPTSADA